MAIRNCDVRVLIYFTQEAQDDNPNIVQTGQLGVAQTNMALRNSGVTVNDLTIIQASIQKLSPLPSGWTGSDMSVDVSRLWLDQRVIDRREEIGADLVMCLVAFPSNGYFPQGWADLTLDPDQAFALVSEVHAIGNTLVFAHECGHLFGCGHHNANDPFARGRSFTKWFTTYRTIVRGGEGDRIPYYSNPNVTYLNKSTGTSTRDNARRLREFGCIVANHRTTNNPSLTASIQGPNNGYPYDYALFQSDVDGGAPGVYSYE